MHQPIRVAGRLGWRNGRFEDGARAVPEETAVALTYNGGTYAVMMATPQDLTDFAIGFSLSEGIVHSPHDILSLDVVDLDDGIELRMWLAQDKAELVNERRRLIAGPTGCGLCGIDSIAEAVRPAAIVAAGRAFAPRDVMSALSGLPPLQEINSETRAAHAAAFWTPAHGIVALREDVDAGVLADYARERLARYKVPKRFEFCEVPKTSTGKIQKNVLRDRAHEL